MKLKTPQHQVIVNASKTFFSASDTLLENIFLQRMQGKAEEEKKKNELELLKKQLEEKKAEYALALEAEARAEVARIQANERNDLKLAHTKSLENIDAYREELENNHRQIVDDLTPKMAEVSEIFVKQILSDRT